MGALLAFFAAILALVSGAGTTTVPLDAPAVPPVDEPMTADGEAGEGTIAACSIAEAPVAPPPYHRTFRGRIGPTEPTLSFSFPVDDWRAERIVARVATPDGAGARYHLALLDPSWRPLARTLGAGDLEAATRQLPSTGPYRVTLASIGAPPLPAEVEIEVTVEHAAYAPAPRATWTFPGWAWGGVGSQGMELRVDRAQAPTRHAVVEAEATLARLTVYDSWGNRVLTADGPSPLTEFDVPEEWGTSPYLVLDWTSSAGGEFTVELETPAREPPYGYFH